MYAILFEPCSCKMLLVAKLKHTIALDIHMVPCKKNITFYVFLNVLHSHTK